MYVTSTCYRVTNCLSQKKKKKKTGSILYREYILKNQRLLVLRATHFTMLYPCSQCLGSAITSSATWSDALVYFCAGTTARDKTQYSLIASCPMPSGPLRIQKRKVLVWPPRAPASDSSIGIHLILNFFSHFTLLKNTFSHYHRGSRMQFRRPTGRFRGHWSERHNYC